MLTTTRPNYAELPTSLLVATFNFVCHQLSLPEVKKFADKATGMKRVEAALDACEAQGLRPKFRLGDGMIDALEVVGMDATNPSLDELSLYENPPEDIGPDDDFVDPKDDKTLTNVQTDGATTTAEPAKPVATTSTLSTLELTHKIQILVENPKRKGSRARKVFDLYRTGQTGEEFVQAVIDAGMDRRTALTNLHWDLDKGFVYLGETADDSVATEASVQPA